MTDLKYHLKIPDTVPMWAVPVYDVIFPCCIFVIYYHHRKDVYDLRHAVLWLAYSVLVSAVITDSIKDAVGRPRPNFYFRCFPDGVAAFDPRNGDVMCTGDRWATHAFIRIMEENAFDFADEIKTSQFRHDNLRDRTTSEEESGKPDHNPRTLGFK